MDMITELDEETGGREPRPGLLDSGCSRSSTVALRYRAVERAILIMRQRFMETLTLQDLADAAQLSPYHFNRVFRSMTGIPPRVFLAAIRMEEAKKLLLTTSCSVTDICFDVGYKSLSPFTSRFNLFVGLPPTRFRQLAQEQFMHTCPEDIWSCLQYNRQKQAGECLAGSIHAPVPFNGLIFVGLFSNPLPQGQPAGCTILLSPGEYGIPSVPDGKYHLFATAMDASQNFLTVLTYGTRLHGGLGIPPVVIRHGRATEKIDLSLSPASWADPPVVVAFPWFLLSRVYQSSAST